MKKVLLSAVAIIALTMSATAQGNFSTLTSGYYKVHVYEPTDASQPKALIVEGDKGLVVIDRPQSSPAFEEQLTNFYMPVLMEINNFKPSGEGVPTEVKAGGNVSKGGMKFNFTESTDAIDNQAALIIGGKIYYSRYAPTREHLSAERLNSREAVNAEFEAAQKAFSKKCLYYIGQYGDYGNQAAQGFVLNYLRDVKKNMEKCSSAEEFVKAMSKAYPKLKGEENLTAVAAKLF
jgi:hypothetical protein